MNEKQKDNVAKFFYDVAKIFIAITVVSPIAQPGSFNRLIFFVGTTISFILFIIAYLLDKKQIK